MLGRLAFIGVAQSAGFKLAEIKELVGGIDDGEALSGHIRTLSIRKLDEVEALLVRTRAMKGWLEVAQRCGCATPEECALFPTAPGDRAVLARPGRASRARTAGGRRSSAAAGALGSPHPHDAPDELGASRRASRSESRRCATAARDGAAMNGSGSTGAIATAISVTRGVVIMPLLSCSGDERYA